MKKFIASFISVCFVMTATFALDMQLRVAPAVIIPANEHYSLGFGLFGQADVDLFGCITAGLEGSVAVEKPEGFDENILFTGGGVGLGGYYYPLSRLYLGAGGAFGLYSFNTKIENETKNATDFYWRGYGELGYRFTPSLTLSAFGGYTQYMVQNSNPAIEGPFAGLSLKFNFSTGNKGSSSFNVKLTQDTDVFPLFMSAYRNCPIGTLTIRNNEGAEVRNVHISFRAGKYTASAFESEVVKRINKYSTVEIPLYADLSSEILKFSENGKISGEIVIDYEFLGKKMQSVESVVLSVYNRNSYSWGNDDALAAFINPEIEEIKEVAKYIAGVARNQLYTGMNRNIQFSAAMVEGLRLAGIKYYSESTTPYKVYHKGTALDSIQYPLQTMEFHSGDYDDLGILLASCLEAVGIPTGYIPMDDDFILLVDLQINPNQAANHFVNSDGLLIDDETAYMPLSMANFEKGFSKSLSEGLKAVKTALTSEDNSYDYYVVEQAWEIYSPAVFTGAGFSFENPVSSDIEKNTKAAIQEYVASELEGVIKNARASGDSNKIGVALVRAGRYADAKAEFTKAADKGSVSAMNNLANIYMIEKNYAAAAAQYKRVLQKEPENKTAERGLSNANEKLSL